MGGAVVVRTLQLQHDLAGTITLEPFVDDGRPGDIAAELLQFFTLIGRGGGRAWRLKPCALTRNSEADDLAWLGRLCKLSTFWPARGPQRNTIGARGGLQSPQGAIGVRFGEVGLVWFFDESPQARQ